MHIWMKIIAVLEIIGGVAGMLFNAWFLITTPFNALSLLIAPVIVGIYVLSLVAGIALWRGRKHGRTASIVVQCIQIPKIVSPALIFMFSFGLDLWVHFVKSAEMFNVGFEFRVGAFYQLFLNVPQAPFGLGASVVGCLFLAMLLTYKPKPAVQPLEPPPPPDYQRGSTLGIG